MTNFSGADVHLFGSEVRRPDLVDELERIGIYDQATEYDFTDPNLGKISRYPLPADGIVVKIPKRTIYAALTIATDKVLRREPFASLLKIWFDKISFQSRIEKYENGFDVVGTRLGRKSVSTSSLCLFNVRFDGQGRHDGRSPMIVPGWMMNPSNWTEELEFNTTSAAALSVTSPLRLETRSVRSALLGQKEYPVLEREVEYLDEEDKTWRNATGEHRPRVRVTYHQVFDANTGDPVLRQYTPIDACRTDLIEICERVRKPLKEEYRLQLELVSSTDVLGVLNDLLQNHYPGTPVRYFPRCWWIPESMVVPVRTLARQLESQDVRIVVKPTDLDDPSTLDAIDRAAEEMLFGEGEKAVEYWQKHGKPKNRDQDEKLRKLKRELEDSVGGHELPRTEKSLDWFVQAWGGMCSMDISRDTGILDEFGIGDDWRPPEEGEDQEFQFATGKRPWKTVEAELEVDPVISPPIEDEGQPRWPSQFANEWSDDDESDEPDEPDEPDFTTDEFVVEEEAPRTEPGTVVEVDPQPDPPEETGPQETSNPFGWG